MKRSQRFSYAAAFGTLAQLCASMVFDAKHAFTYDGPAYLKGFYYFFLSISLFWTFMLLEQMFIYFFLRKLKKNFIQFAYQSLIEYLLSVKLVNSAFWHYSLILFWLLITVFIALVSMLIYGMCYFPLFAGITVGSPMGYFIATLFFWVFTTEFFQIYFVHKKWL